MPTLRKKLISNSFYNLIATLIETIGRMIASIVIARKLGPTNMGLYSFVTFLVGVLDIATNMGLGHIAIKYISEFTGSGDSENRNKVISYVLKRKFVLTLFTAVVLFFSSGIIGEFYEEPALRSYVMLATILLLPTGISAILRAIIKGLQEYRALVFRSLLITPIYVLLIYCVLTVGYGIKGLLIVGTIVAFIEINMYYYYFSKYVKFRFYIKDGFTPDIKKRIFSYNWQVAIIVILDSVVWTKSEVFFLGKLSTKESVAFYSLAYSLASWTVAFLPGVFTNVLYPAISEMYGEEDQQGIKKVYLHSTRYLMMFSIPACLLGMALSQEVVLLFYGRPYLDVVPVLNILLISSCVGITASPGSSVIYATERQRYILIVNVFVTILNIALNIFLISKYGAIGAAISNSLSQILAVSVVMTFLCKSMVIRFPFKDAMKIIFSSIVMFMFVEFFLKWWGGVLGLMLSIIAGTSIYLYLVARLRILKESDKGILDGIQSRLPEFVQVPFNKFLLLGK